MLQDKNKKVKVKKETANAAAIYKFEAKRKRWGTTEQAVEENLEYLKTNGLLRGREQPWSLERPTDDNCSSLYCSSSAVLYILKQFSFFLINKTNKLMWILNVDAICVFKQEFNDL